MKNKVKLFFLGCGGFLASVAPLVTVLVLNRERYIRDAGDGWRLGVGGAIVAVLIFLKVIGKLKPPSHITTVALLMLLSWLLSAVLGDLTLLCAMYLCGEGLERIFFYTPIKRLREKMQMEKQADATADRVEELLKNYMATGEKHE